MPFKSSTRSAAPLTRRGFLKGLAVTAAGLHIPKTLAAMPREYERSIALHNLHTGEKAKLVYWEQGKYLDESLDELNYLLRDYRTGDVHTIDPTLIDMLHLLRLRAGRKAPFEIISGYRSPKTNAMLHAKSDGVAKHSLHMEGQALDIRLPGQDLHKLHQSAVDLKVGGVGLYTKSNFVHIDTGRVRYWGS